MLVIAHRGASGYRPEHTLAAYRLAIEMGADVIEPDLVPTRDGHLVCRHDNELSDTTDVASRRQFASRRRTQRIDGQELTGWFVEDFTLDELRTLRAVERLPALRPGSAAFDGRFPIPTFAEVLELAREAGASRGRSVGVYPETKHPSHAAALGLALEPRLLDSLRAAGMGEGDAWIQSFEGANLRALARESRVPRVQLVYPDEGVPVGALPTSVRTSELDGPRLQSIAGFAQVVGVHTSAVLDAEGRGTGLVERAHDQGLEVHVWTLRAECAFLPARHVPRGAPPIARGDIGSFAQELAALGVDGVFTDHPDAVLAALGRDQ